MVGEVNIVLKILIPILILLVFLAYTIALFYYWNKLFKKMASGNKMVTRFPLGVYFKHPKQVRGVVKALNPTPQKNKDKTFVTIEVFVKEWNQLVSIETFIDLKNAPPLNTVVLLNCYYEPTQKEKVPK